MIPKTKIAAATIAAQSPASCSADEWAPTKAEADTIAINVSDLREGAVQRTLAVHQVANTGSMAPGLTT